MADVSAMEEVLGHACNDLRAIPHEVHLLCPKVSDDDDEDYDDFEEPGDVGLAEKERRVEEGKGRLDLVYRCSLILGFPDETAAELRKDFVERTGAFLTTCAGCVRQWHRNRKRFLKELSESQPDSVVSQMGEELDMFDAQRITGGLEGASEFILQHNGMVEQKTFIEEDRAELLIALYESLCCLSYLSQPKNREHFNFVFEKVQEKRVLKLGEVLPTMTQFLFDSEFKVRHTFAKTAWTRMASITADDFEWAVKDSLAHALRKASLPHLQQHLTSSQVQRLQQYFWEGFALIMKTIPQNLVVRSLEVLDVQPSIYQTMLDHMGTKSESNLAVVLKVFCYVLRKGPRGLWGTFAQYSPNSIGEQVFASPAYEGLLAHTRDFSLSVPEDEYLVGPVGIAWVKPFLDSIPTNQKGDACDSLLHHFLDNLAKNVSMSPEGRAACYRGATDALLASMTVFIMPNFNLTTNSATLYTNRMLNLTLKYSDTLKGMVQLSQRDPQQAPLSQNARSVIGCALMLDSRITAEEFSSFQKGDKFVQNMVPRDSSGLWKAFLDILVPGATEAAKAMLLAIGPLVVVDIFRPKKKESLSKPKESFNSEFRKTSEVIGRMIGKLDEFDTFHIKQLCSEPQTIQPIVAALISGEASVNEAAMAFIKTITDEVGRDDAVLRLLELHFSPMLISFTQAVVEVVGGKDALWSQQFQVLSLSNAVLKGLCDPASGILRSKQLNDAERDVVKGWWASQWGFIEEAFNNLDNWSKVVETETMKTFCRANMELADALLAQDGLISSALGPQSWGHSAITANDSSKAALKDLLADPRDNSMGMAKMLRLKDRRLIEVTVNSLTKLLRRLAENDMSIPPILLEYIRTTYTRNEIGKYKTATNLDDIQRAELMRALGEDEDEDEDEIQVVDVKKAEAPKKQMKLDSWSRSGDSNTAINRTDRDDARELSKTVEKKASLLDQFRSRQPAKPEAKSLVPKSVSKPAAPTAASGAKLKEQRQREKEERRRRDAEIVAKAKALRGAKPLVAGEGSGLQGLTGVLGKDHAPQKGEMMVDSSSEEADDSEDEAAFREQTKAGQQRIEEASKRVTGLKLQAQGPVKKAKVVRSQKDLRARVTPPMDILHQAVLEWDIFHEGNDPPTDLKCSRVSNTYDSSQDYNNTFFPLLLSEAWRSFVTAKDETTSTAFGIKVLNRANVDNFVEVSTAMPMKETKDRWMAEGDIVLFSTSAKPLEDPKEPHCLARIWRTFVKNGNLETSYRLSGRAKGEAGVLSNLLRPGFELYALKITNMTTIEREYATLRSMQFYDLAPEVLDAKPSPMLNYNDENVHNTMKNYHLNSGQAKAILNAVDNDAFTLVQGPPGTGKTKTIVAMVGALMTGQLSKPAGTTIKRPGAQNGNSGPSKKLLVCAPSNAAVDELVLRLKGGVKTRSGNFHPINVLRLGRSDAINAAVKDVTLDELVKGRVEDEMAKNNGPSDRQKMHDEAGQLKNEINDLRPILETARATGERSHINELERRFHELKTRQRAIGARIDADKDSGTSVAQENETRKRKIQQEILDSAHVLCSTLSGSGHDMFGKLNVEFETVIIDEAAQCVELSALIPLKYGCTKCVLVGDPKQLPPTVLSQSAQQYGYDQSLFVRMQRNHPERIHLLDTQYRMHPEISLFPSREFYESRLIDGDDMLNLRHQPWHQTGLLGPYRFFDVKGSQERGRKGQSLANHEEIRVAMQLYERFKMDNPQIDMKGKIGIITPYKAQLGELREKFGYKYGKTVSEDIEFNTTDAFQGRECEIIIFSCVRASPTGGIGFMTDIRRMNVGLTRAKSSLWILGDSQALAQGEFWNKLIQDAKARERYTTGDIMSLLRKPGARLPRPTSGNPAPSSLPVAPCASALAPPPPPSPKHVEAEDVDMADAPPMKPHSNRNKTAQLPQTYSVYQRQAPPPQAFSNLPTGYAGLNERGEAVTSSSSAVTPTIQSSSGQKRPRESTADGGQPTKRASSGFLPGKSRLVQRPTDPSAMSALGIEPPKPPASKGTAKPPPNAPKGPSGSRPMAPPKKKPASDPFIKRKPKPR